MWICICISDSVDCICIGKMIVFDVVDYCDSVGDYSYMCMSSY